jgi:hypothetical protein
VITLLVPLVVITSGFAAGGLMIATLGGAPLLLRLPTPQYVPVHQFLVKQFDPFMPINLVGAAILDALIAGFAHAVAARILAGLATVLYTIVMYVSLAKNVPINKWVGRLDADNLPDNWEQLDPRVRWKNWNLVRTCLATTGLVLNAAVVGALL